MTGALPGHSLILVYGSRLTVPLFSAISWCLSSASKGSGKTCCERKALCRVVRVAVVKPEGPRGELAKAAIYNSASVYVFQPHLLLSASPVRSSLSLN